ncbi:MAG: prepilin peptidase [Actinobacteria bacterium]|nr:prepilin peptidase [Actinomycetota bacterium]MCG2818263.1 prepilin peptidase [Actinomycetes bacterium]MBU4219587.1 prepilin peptidase [Actinomycetota bacterium]MBU4358800.1 prepilin peptidase [Actinomycetota bacterium]MBU4391441.1 prepilin peptidase [Actinomycetota bacterium]
MYGVVSLVILVAFCLAAMYVDVRRGRIPNLLNATGFMAGVLLACITDGTKGLAGSLSGSLLGLSILLPPFLLHMVGGGDVKFLAASGAIVGWHVLWVSFLAGATLGGLTGIALLVARDRSIERLLARFVLLKAGLQRKQSIVPRSIAGTCAHTRMPYAVPLSAGLIAVSSITLLM